MSEPDVLLQLLSRSERLESLPRTGWLTCGITAPESVASHSYQVALVALWLADVVEEEVNVELVLRIALLHDLGESELTDIPSPAKRRIGTEQMRNVERSVTRELVCDLPGSWSHAVDLFFEQKTTESLLVKAADRIQMLAKACQYRWQGRGNTERFWRGSLAIEGAPAIVNQIICRLEEHHRAGTWIDEDGTVSPSPTRSVDPAG